MKWEDRNKRVRRIDISVAVDSFACSTEGITG